jgi:hypothetical protein
MHKLLKTYWLGGLNGDLGLEECVLDVYEERERVAVRNCSQIANVALPVSDHLLLFALYLPDVLLASRFFLDPRLVEPEAYRMI